MATLIPMKPVTTRPGHVTPNVVTSGCVKNIRKGCAVTVWNRRDRREEATRGKARGCERESERGERREERPE
eukprot:1060563-Rhodomonas_salina.2